MLHGEAVPASEKVLSLFEPHTQAIRRHKPGKLTEFGRKVLLDETEGGIVSHYAVLDSVGLEHPHLIASLDAHRQRFGRAPDLVAGDRGLYSPENEVRARERGVRRVVLPRAASRPSGPRPMRSGGASTGRTTAWSSRWTGPPQRGRDGSARTSSSSPTIASSTVTTIGRRRARRRERQQRRAGGTRSVPPARSCPVR